ncbi:uncharacterized protein [Henckelia pumila]|uniref:uncharacterized protein n=1 Tax=Henckelia pumila TaxID=405737 RepID=UPI003C6DFC34
MVDATSGGVFVYKTPQDARNLIENITANSQQFYTNRTDPAPRRNNEVNVFSLEQQLIDLVSLMHQIAVGNGHNVKVCGICAAMGNPTDMCLTLQEGSIEQVNATGGFPGPPQRNYDPYSNTYNPGWKDHPNLRYGNPSMNQPAPQVQPSNQSYRPPYPQKLQRPQIPTSVLNPKENFSAINLRSGRELKVREKVVQEPVKNEDDKESKVEENEIIQKDTPKGKFPPISEYKPIAPFPLALKDSRKDEGIKELKQKLKGCQKVELGEQISAMIQRKIPVKCKKIGPLKETAIVIQMTDRSTIYPRGVIEDVLVKVDKLVFPADFYVLDMKNSDLNNPILLGRPFLKTSKSVIEVNNDTLTMEFDGEIVKFNIIDTLKFPSYESNVNTLDINDHLSQKNKKFVNEDKVKEGIARPAENSNARIFLFDLQASKTEPKLPPDRAKEIPMGKGKNHQEIGISKKSKERKHGPKLTVKTLKWGKVDKVIKYKPP